MLRDRGHERRADAGLGGRDRVVALVVAVDGEEAGVLAGDADYEGPVAVHDLVVRVRETAGERLGHAAAQLVHRREHVLERHRGQHYKWPRPNPSRVMKSPA